MIGSNVENFKNDQLPAQNVLHINIPTSAQNQLAIYTCQFTGFLRVIQIKIETISLKLPDTHKEDIETVDTSLKHNIKIIISKSSFSRTHFLKTKTPVRTSKFI